MMTFTDDPTGGAPESGPEEVKAHSDSGREGTAHSAARILVIDDNTDLATAISEYLSQYFTVSYVGSSRAALDKLETEKFDVVVTDYLMPMFDGLDMLKRFREKDIWVCTILISAHCNLGLSLKAINSGHVDRLLGKPFNNYDLKKAITEILDTRSKRIAALTSND